MVTAVAHAQSIDVHGIGHAGTVRLQESPLLTLGNYNEDEVTTFTDSAKLDILDNTNQVQLSGDAQVRRPDAILKGDNIIYNRETGEVQAQGHARMLREGTLVTSPGLKFNVNTKTGRMESPVYRLQSGGAGNAGYAEAIDDNHLRLGDAIYSGCQCDNKFWYIKSEKVDIYDDENEGIARNGTLYIKGIPVLWSPYLTFPVKREKKTGWLAPSFTSTSNSGLGLSLPYFINLAPNYDLTLTPQVYSKRGWMMGGEFRYLMPSYSGQLSGTYMTKDRKLDEKRWSVNWTHRQSLGTVAGLKLDLNIDVHGVSDPDYYRDFDSVAVANRADRSYLSKSAYLTFSGYKYWSGYLLWQKYQGLHDLSGSSPSYYYQYEREPELMVRGAIFDWNGFDVSMQNTITRFTYPKDRTYANSVGYTNTNGITHVDGTRYVSYTQVSYPIIRAGWYVTPKLGLHASHYTTNWYKQYGNTFTSVAGTQYRSLSRVLPIASLDAGMTFERTTTLFGKPRIQTLEPRIYYLYIPYTNQDDLPIYDTAPSQFNFGTAFSENVYSGGWDRINDANQVTLGLTSRWLDMDSGKERMVVQLAQKFYFKRQRVYLSQSERRREESRSEFLANLSVAVTDKLNIEVGTQLNTYSRKVAQTYETIRWFPKRLASISLTHRYQQDPFYYTNASGSQIFYPYQLAGKNTFSLAGQWPITKNLYAVGRYDYSIKERRSTQSILGLEYKGDCCWTGRVVFQRYAVSKQKTNTSLFFQLELTGLGAVGSNPMSVLRDSIPGYQSVKDPAPVQSPFERYE
nr:LPS-assembly protein LptD [Pelistega europaea]